jgi:hypothetical protein
MWGPRSRREAESPSPATVLGVEMALFPRQHYSKHLDDEAIRTRACCSYEYRTGWRQGGMMQLRCGGLRVVVRSELNAGYRLG